MSVGPVNSIYTQTCAPIIDSTTHEILARPPGLCSMNILNKAGAEQLDWQLIVPTVKHNIFLDENRIILPIHNEYDTYESDFEIYLKFTIFNFSLILVSLIINANLLTL